MRRFHGGLEAFHVGGERANHYERIVWIGGVGVGAVQG